MRWWILVLMGCGTTTDVPQNLTGLADVVSVEVSGDDGAYTFAVGLRSEETGCDLYADWWEVVDPQGSLVYRRVLGHSHPDEQPFVRSGGPVDIQADDLVWIRGHMAPGGYGGVAYSGSVSEGFVAADLTENWDALATEAPLPDGCAF